MARSRLMLFARSICAVAAQAVVAAIFALRSSPTPWHDAEPWLPVYGTLIDAGCLTLLWQLTRREGIGLFDLVGVERARLVRDVLLGFALIPVGLAFILSGVYAAGWLLYGTLSPPYLFGPLPLPAAFYGVLVFPFVWGLTEQMTYNGYLVPRFRILWRASWAVACVAFVWSFQHVVMPLTFDAKFTVVSAAAPVGSVRDRARPDGRRERVGRRPSAAIESVTDIGTFKNGFVNSQIRRRGIRDRFRSPLQTAMPPEPLDRRCPACKTGTGLARTVSTISGRPASVAVRMVCQSCEYEWTTEHDDPALVSHYTSIDKAS